ncbi:E3 ubiquitin-protein ligase UPL4 isoform X3 [Vigna angularis]|uniref:E3 ubiquitin-protein ligase UPL4 isoform X3 n=1 Tax=Phaseolus angularis TaxID=3914 RepID=UPI0022B36FD0|nr:E3 ubiquitin-protein ligase UPL4 isoform X3 [Vigna angularis]
MGSRGQKRPDMVDELPADKRACSSLDFRPSSSNSSVQTHMNSIVEAHDHDMDTSSSASASSQSEGDPEKDSTYGSCDSDDMDQQHNSTLYEYHRRRLSSDHGKFKNIISSLSELTEPSCQLAVLTELCEVLSFCTEGSLSSMTSDLLSPLLVKLAKDEKNPDIMLFSIRAITYICDLYPRSAGFLVQHDAVPALCQRLFAIEYQDVAEQCLQALEKISREQPLACLEAGAIMAVLSYIDFFSTSIQRVALSTVVNICKKLPSENPSLFMEAVPILCNLLQYEDRQLVENVATCLIKIVERVGQSSEMLDELCKHGLIQQVTHLLSSNGQTALSQLIYNGLIGLLVKLSSGSLIAFRTLYELNISSILREILSTFDLSYGVSTSQLVGGHCNRVYEALKLLNELLPDRAKDQNDQLVLEKESFLDNHSDLLQRLGIDLFSMLIQVFNSGASLFVCHACLSVMYKIVSSSKSEVLVELLKNANISRCSIPYPCLKVRFARGEGEIFLSDYTEDFHTVDPFSCMHSIEAYLRPKVSPKSTEHSKSSSIQAVLQPESPPIQSPSHAISVSVEIPVTLGPVDMMTDFPDTQKDQPKLTQLITDQVVIMNAGESSSSRSQGYAVQELQMNAEPSPKLEKQDPSFCSNEAAQKLVFYIEGQRLDQKLTLYQAILGHIVKQNDSFSSAKLWSQVHTITYRRAVESEDIIPPQYHFSPQDISDDKVLAHYQHTPFFSDIFFCELVSDLEKSSPTYDILFLLKCLERMNRLIFHLMSRERIWAFAKGKVDDLDSLKITVPSVPQNEFVSSKLTEKLEQQMRDTLAVSVGGMPLWCSQLMTSCPFLFSFEARCKYFKLKAFGQPQVQPHLSHNGSGAVIDRRLGPGGLPKKKFLVHRNQILESAAKMMELHACHKVVLEVEYDEEVGTGLGPTLEFYTLVCHEFQKSGLGMWREDVSSFILKSNLQAEEMGIHSFYGLFPRPWSTMQDTSGDIQFTDVAKKFFLLGQVVAKALQDGRILDLHFSKAFYKLILGKELSLYDILSFDPGLGRVLQEFQALVIRKSIMESVNGGNSELQYGKSFRDTSIEDLCLDFTLPGYPDIVLASGTDHSMVNMRNLEDYVSCIVDATVRSGISRQVEAFKSGFNQVFSIEHLQIFNEEEVERMLCGEYDSWAINELGDNIKFDHGYTASSPPIVNLLEIVREFDHEQRRAFLQFVTGAPRLPPGGLASLNPKLTIVRKHCNNRADTDLPSVMTCANYLKLPPYSSKERMKEKLLYAITEGQGSFHLS